MGNFEQQNIILMNADGTDKVKLTPTSQSIYGNGEIKWSSDGKRIVYLAYIGSPYDPKNDIYALDTESHKLTSLTKSHNILGWTLSPDSTMIAYTVGSWESGKCFQTFIVDLEGKILSERKDIDCYAIVGPWKLGSDISESMRQIGTPKEQSWEFETAGDTEGWMEINDFEPLQVSNGFLLTKSTGDDPYMHSPSISLLNAAATPKIEINMKISSGSLGQLFFITNTDTTYDESKSLQFKIVGDGQFHTYILDMSKVIGWDGSVRQIRLDPTDTSATIEIDYVRILKP